MGKKEVLVIGGGIAGISFAKAIKERSGESLNVTVVTKDPFYISGPSRPLLLTNEQSYHRIIRGYEEVGQSGINVVFGLVSSIDPGERVVKVSENPTKHSAKKEVKYDYLAIAPGVVFDGSKIEGYQKYWWKNSNVYEPGRVDVLKRKLWTQEKGVAVVYAPKAPYRCAPAPAETAFAIHTVLSHRGKRGNFRIVHIDGNEKVQPPLLHDIIKERYEKAGIELITNKEIVGIEESEVILNDGEKVPYTLLAMLEPNRAPAFIKEAGLGEAWVEVRDPKDLRTPKYDDIYAFGDAAKLPFPKNQEIAYESSIFAANKLLEEVGGEAYNITYSFVGWAYVGNLEGELRTESLQFGLNFNTSPPKGSKDATPKNDYTSQKDSWEQSYLNRLYHSAI